MRFLSLFSMLVLLTAGSLGCSPSEDATAPGDPHATKEKTPEGTPLLKAVANLTNGEGHSVGQARITEDEHGVRIHLTANHLAPGEHGFHIHETGQCEAPDFESAGGHFNPKGKKHGKENPEGAHAGDLDNITVNPDGKVDVTLTVDGVTLNPEASHSLLKSGGTALVIHEKADDLKSDPAGNAGDRIACGVIKETK